MSTHTRYPSYFFIIAGFICLLSACNDKKQIKGFNEAAWRTDPKGCKSVRRSIADSIIQYKKLWIGIDDDLLLKVLGNPDKSFFYKRNAKAFVYYISPGSQCPGAAFVSDGQRFVAEINATGYVNMIRLEY